MNMEDQSKKEDQNKLLSVKNTKDELIANIKEWIKIDSDLTKLKLEIKEKTTKKKIITETLVNVMKNNAIDCFDINGGALIYKQKKSKKTISGKFLLTQLEEYYKDQPEVAKDNRIEVIKDEIKRKIDK